MTNAIFMQNIIKRHQLECVFFSNFSRSKMTHSRSVARCVAIIVIFYKKIIVVFRLNLIKIIHQNATNCINQF